jgi:hypothetical protein
MALGARRQQLPVKMLQLTDAANGTPISVPASSVVLAEEQPAGQPCVLLTNGQVRQTKESVAEINRMLEEAE